MYDNILDIEQKIEDDEIHVKSINFSNFNEIHKVIETIKQNKRIHVENGEYILVYEPNRLYEAIKFVDEDDNLLFKRIISTKKNEKYNAEFDNYLLPVGTVIQTKNGTNQLIISRALEKDSEYIEYVTCDNNLGYSDQIQLLTHNDIAKVLSLPYEDEQVLKSTLRIKKWLDQKNGEDNEK